MGSSRLPALGCAQLGANGGGRGCGYRNGLAAPPFPVWLRPVPGRGFQPPAATRRGEGNTGFRKEIQTKQDWLLKQRAFFQNDIAVGRFFAGGHNAIAPLCLLVVVQPADKLDVLLAALVVFV